MNFGLLVRQKTFEDVNKGNKINELYNAKKNIYEIYDITFLSYKYKYYPILPVILYFFVIAHKCFLKLCF